MKVCPVCNRTYNDLSQNFCEEDGATLIAVSSGFGQPAGFGAPPQTFGAMPPVVLPKKQKSALPWVLGVFAALIIVGLLGFVGLMALVAANMDNKNSANTGSSNKGSVYEPKSNKSSAGTFKVDFTRWREFKQSDGEAKIIGDEYQLNCTIQNYFYVVVSSSKYDDNLLTNNATARVTVRSVTGDSPSLGYGIVVNSDVKPIVSGYAFLIYTGDNPKYRVVRHVDKKEIVVKEWTAASQIRTGTQTNQLEVRTKGKTMSFYINGQLATTVTDESGSDQGIVGIYTSDTKPVGFSNLEVIQNDNSSKSAS
jgi:hypothetical protein